MSPINSVSSTTLPSALNSGRAALNSANTRLAQDAQAIASPPSDNVTAALVDTSQTLLLAAAAADIVKSANQMLGTLLDTHA